MNNEKKLRNYMKELGYYQIKKDYESLFIEFLKPTETYVIRAFLQVEFKPKKIELIDYHWLSDPMSNDKFEKLKEIFEKDMEMLKEHLENE